MALSLVSIVFLNFSPAQQHQSYVPMATATLSLQHDRLDKLLLRWSTYISNTSTVVQSFFRFSSVFPHEIATILGSPIHRHSRAWSPTSPLRRKFRKSSVQNFMRSPSFMEQWLKPLSTSLTYLIQQSWSTPVLSPSTGVTGKIRGLRHISIMKHDNHDN